MDALGKFRREHLIDVQTCGIPFKTDTEYIQAYSSKMETYRLEQEWLAELAEVTKWISFFAGFLMFLIGVGSGYAGIPMMIFGFDMMQSSFTGTSIFSLAFGWAAGIRWGRAYAEKDLRTVWGQEFNVYSPLSHTKSLEGRILEALWSTVFTIALSKGMGYLMKGLAKLISIFKPAWYASLVAKQKMAQIHAIVKTMTEAGKSVDEILLTISQNAKLAKFLQTTALTHVIGKKVVAIRSMSEAVISQARGVFESVTKMFTKSFKIDLIKSMMQPAAKSGGLLGSLIIMKKIVFGWITPADWLPDSWGVGNGFLGYVKYFALNYLDNFLFAFVAGENTIAFLYALYLSASTGHPVGFAGTAGGPTI